MVVSLKVPDTTAITALQALHKLGIIKIKDLKRSDYYKFSVDGTKEQFKDKICKVDILVNANKHSYGFSIQKDSSVKLLVKNINGGESSLLSTLSDRLGFKNIKKAEKAVMWSMAIDADEKEAKKIAEKAAKELLVSEHYQEYEIL